MTHLTFEGSFSRVCCRSSYLCLVLQVMSYDVSDIDKAAAVSFSRLYLSARNKKASDLLKYGVRDRCLVDLVRGVA